MLLINCYGCLLRGHFFSVSETSLAAQGTPTGVDSMSTSCQSNLESLVLCPKSADTPRVKPQATCMITFACEMSSHIVFGLFALFKSRRKTQSTSIRRWQCP